MDLLSKYDKGRAYSDRISTSAYLQEGQLLQEFNMHQKSALSQEVTENNLVFPTIVDLFFSCFDHHYSLVENKDKQLYMKQLIMNIATEIDEDKSHKYDNFNYLKCMNSGLIQQGLQTMKTVSCLLYLSDYYGVTTHVYLGQSEQHINTSDKDRKEFNVLFKDNKWSELSSKPNYKEGEFKSLGTGLVLDVTTKDIYKKYLNPIGKYKAPELVEIAKGMNLPLERDGKKKVKKEMYDDINFYQLNL